MTEFDDVAFLIDNRVARGSRNAGCCLVMVLGLDHLDDREIEI